MKVLQITILLLILAGASFAQIKIAVVDTNVFENEKLGIIELVIANKKVSEEFKPLSETLQIEGEKIIKLSKEMVKMLELCEKTPCSPKLIEEKIEKVHKLEKELLTKINEARVKFEKRELEIVEPVKKRIAEKLDIFKQKKGYFSIFDRSKIDDSFIDEKLDITTDFIKFCNKEFEKEKTQNK